MRSFIAAVLLSSIFSAHADWQLATPSSLTFTTTKNTHLVEINRFTRLDGYVKSSGEAKLQIDLASIDSNIAIRDERMKELLFNVAQFSRAELTTRIPESVLTEAQDGNIVLHELTGDLWLNGSRQPITVPVIIVPAVSGAFVISNTQPVLIQSDAFALTQGIQALRHIAALDSITEVVPVHFTLTFTPSSQ